MLKRTHDAAQRAKCSAGAKRSRRKRLRRKLGEIVVPVVVDEIELKETLIGAGLLCEADYENTAVLSEALSNVVRTWLKRDTRVATDF